MIGIVDYGRGNLRSVEKGLEKVGFVSKILTNPNELATVQGVILPGVGAFADAMDALELGGWIDPLKTYARSGAPFLGICLGMQVLFEVGEEHGEHQGLGLIPGRVVRFPSGLKVPQMGWNNVQQLQDSFLMKGIPDNSYFYFVHSYYAVPNNNEYVIGSSEYGVNFPALVGKGNVWGAQFHPEKSSPWGLNQGRLEDSTIYADHPAEVAKKFVEQGAEFLHVVDLNGAFSGRAMNDQAIREIVRSVSLKIQVGGGIRTLERIEELLSLGVSRVILGTVAVKQPELVAEAVRRFGEQVVVGIDARDGMVAVQGWAEATEISAAELGLSMKEVGVKRIIFTDIARDGMLQGPNVASTVKLAQVTGLIIIASGGISVLQDLQDLQNEVDKGVSIEGAIVGKALYSGAFTLEQALAVVQSLQEGKGEGNAC